MKKGDTPRTDNHIVNTSNAYDANGIVCATVEYVDAEFARDLERELNETKRIIQQMHRDYGCEVRDSCHVGRHPRWERAAKLQQERDCLKRELDDLRNRLKSFLNQTQA
jgi:hypothetical protein